MRIHLDHTPHFSRWAVHLLLGFGLLGSLPGLAAPGEWRLSLDGPWQFSTNAAPTRWDTLSVPGNWDTRPAYSAYRGRGWYRRDFVVPRDWAGRHIRLRFEAVYHDASVTLNGVELGKHSGGYTPFEFDVTKVVKPGSTNSAVVCADNTYRRGAWWHWGGISRSVSLIANNEARIVWQHIRSEPDVLSGTAELFVACKLANAGVTPLKGSLEFRLDGVAEPAMARDALIPAQGETVVELKTTLSKGRVRLWDFDHPNLYQLTAQLSVGGRVMHQQDSRFGIRKLEVTRDSLLLNGERVRLCGFNRVSDSPETGNTEPEALVQRDVELMKRCGANLARLMHYPQAPALLDYLDEQGMLIFEEIPVWGAGDPNMQPDNPLARQWMSEMVERDYNHPCIIGWSVGNELLQHYAYVKSMLNFTRTLDPHRLVTHVSFTGQRKEYNVTNDPISLSDIILLNTYNPSAHTLATVHAKWPEKPVFLSEFGIKQFGANLDATIPGLEEAYRRATSASPYVVGVSLWTFNDYRSDYKNTPSSGNREWGVVDVQRRPKAAYEQVRRLFSPVGALELNGRTVTVVPRRPEEVPSYTLRGYELRWTLSGPGGTVLRSGAAKLPELKPGSAPWTTRLSDLPSGALKIQLVTPTGYDVAELKAQL